jgi:hypothetical protein
MYIYLVRCYCKISLDGVVLLCVLVCMCMVVVVGILISHFVVESSVASIICAYNK